MANGMGKTVSSDRFYFLGSKITWTVTAFSKSKRHSLFGRKVMINLDSILKSSHFLTWSTKVCIVKADFSSIHVGLKKAEG